MKKVIFLLATIICMMSAQAQKISALPLFSGYVPSGSWVPATIGANTYKVDLKTIALDSIWISNDTLYSEKNGAHYYAIISSSGGGGVDASAWHNEGNAGTNSGLNWIGTNDTAKVVMRQDSKPFLWAVNTSGASDPSLIIDGFNSNTGINIDAPNGIIKIGDWNNIGSNNYLEINAANNYLSWNTPNIHIDGVPYIFPTGQGAANTFLGNDGSGTLGWNAIPSPPLANNQIGVGRANVLSGTDSLKFAGGAFTINSGINQLELMSGVAYITNSTNTTAINLNRFSTNGSNYSFEVMDNTFETTYNYLRLYHDSIAAGQPIHAPTPAGTPGDSLLTKHHADGSFEAIGSLPYSFLSGTVPTWNQNTTGTAANITGTSNSTLTVLSALALPYSQLSGSVPIWNQNTTGSAAILTTARNINNVAFNGSTAINVLAPNVIPTGVKTTTYSATAGDFVPCDNTSGSFTVTLPTAPTDRTIIGVKMITQSGTNTITIAAGGSDVFNKAGGSTTLTLSLANQGIFVQYSSSASIWYVVSDDLPASKFVQTSIYAYQALTDGSTITANVNSNMTANFYVTLGGNRTLSITNLVNGAYGRIEITQDATGSRTLALPSGSIVGSDYGSGTTLNLTATPNATDIATWSYDGTRIIWGLIKNVH